MWGGGGGARGVTSSENRMMLVLVCGQPLEVVEGSWHTTLVCFNHVHVLTGRGVGCCRQQFHLTLSPSRDLLMLTCCEAVSCASQLNPGRERTTLCSFNFQLLRDLVILTCCEKMGHTSQLDPGGQANSTLLLFQFSTAKGFYLC